MRRALTVLGLHALQHRGQEASGIVTFDDGQFIAERHVGLVGDIFGGKNSARAVNLKGAFAIGHNRYSTAGGSGARNIQPMFADLAGGGIAIAHNGNLTNALHAARRTGARGRDLPVDLGHRSHHPSRGAQPLSARSSTS